MIQSNLILLIIGQRRANLLKRFDADTQGVKIMDREYYELGNIEPSDYDNEVWSSGEYRNHCSPHMEVIDDVDLSDDGWRDE